MIIQSIFDLQFKFRQLYKLFFFFFIQIGLASRWMVRYQSGPTSQVLIGVNKIISVLPVLMPFSVTLHRFNLSCFLVGNLLGYLCQGFFYFLSTIKTYRLRSENA